MLIGRQCWAGVQQLHPLLEELEEYRCITTRLDQSSPNLMCSEVDSYCLRCCGVSLALLPCAQDTGGHLGAWGCHLQLQELGGRVRGILKDGDVPVYFLFLLLTLHVPAAAVWAQV